MQLVETRADMHVFTSDNGCMLVAVCRVRVRVRPRVQVNKVTQGTLILHNVMTTTMDNVIIKIKQKCDRSSNFVVCIKQLYYGGLVGMTLYCEETIYIRGA